MKLLSKDSSSSVLGPTRRTRNKKQNPNGLVGSTCEPLRVCDEREAGPQHCKVKSSKTQHNRIKLVLHILLKARSVARASSWAKQNPVAIRKDLEHLNPPKPPQCGSSQDVSGQALQVLDRFSNPVFKP